MVSAAKPWLRSAISLQISCQKSIACHLPVWHHAPCTPVTKRWLAASGMTVLVCGFCLTNPFAPIGRNLWWEKTEYSDCDGGWASIRFTGKQGHSAVPTPHSRFCSAERQKLEDTERSTQNSWRKLLAKTAEPDTSSRECRFKLSGSKSTNKRKVCWQI